MKASVLGSKSVEVTWDLPSIQTGKTKYQIIAIEDDGNTFQTDANVIGNPCYIEEWCDHMTKLVM